MECIITKHYKFCKEDVDLIKKELGTYRKIAKLLGCSSSYVHDVFTNKRYATQKFLDFLNQHFDLSKLYYCEVEKPFITF